MKSGGAVLRSNEILDLAHSRTHQGLIPHLTPPRASYLCVGAPHAFQISALPSESWCCPVCDVGARLIV